ncbi:MAG TPA: hypothetical protein VHA82_12330 [Ramlibacter sp.]|uniref:hypothetical protein n=1 Tax=Ramlibacter sp. TaxID=1917967 RepID=UPI002CF0C49A|nr:hypothetical protein [Ramlibacter sp.]HVZ44588.1 hypothetical protein [Ramlibacter sp.]
MTSAFTQAVHDFEARMADEARRHLRRWLNHAGGASFEEAVEWVLDADLSQAFQNVRSGSGASAIRLAVEQLRAHVEAEGYSDWRGGELRRVIAAQVQEYLDL